MKAFNRKGKRKLHLSPKWHIHFGPLLKMIYTDTREEVFGLNSSKPTRLNADIDLIYDFTSDWMLELWHDDTDEGHLIEFCGLRSIFKYKHIKPRYVHIPDKWWEDDK